MKKKATSGSVFSVRNMLPQDKVGSRIRYVARPMLRRVGVMEVMVVVVMMMVMVIVVVIVIVMLKVVVMKVAVVMVLAVMMVMAVLQFLPR